MFKKAVLVGLGLFVSVSAAQAGKYEDCMLEAGKVGDSALAQCMNDKTKELMVQLKSTYENVTKNEDLAPWSGGVGMKSGNLRVMYDNWIAYRDKFCSAYTVSMKNYMGSDEYNNAECLMDLTEDHLIKVEKLMQNSYSTAE